MVGEELKWRQLARNQLMSQQGHHFSPHRKAKANIKCQILGKLASSGISNIAFASVLLGDKSSEKLIIMIINILSNRKTIYQ